MRVTRTLRAWTSCLAGTILLLLAAGMAAAAPAETVPISPLQLEFPPGDVAPLYGVRAHLDLHPATREMALARAEAQDDPVDLTHLNLEQLLGLKINTINVLGGHTHLKGQHMVSYQYMLMNMGGYLDGDRSLSNQQVLQRFPTIHTSMTMEMHMLELMYAPSDDVTLMAMVPYKVMGMRHLRRDGLRFPTSSEGFGDVQVMALYTFSGNQRKRGNRFLLNAGLSFPSGSIYQDDFVPGKGLSRLEYPMQLGSGTVDLLPGITYLGDSKRWAWGAQLLGTVRLGTNEIGYKFGDQLHATTWAVYRVKDWVAPSVRLLGGVVGNVHGIDPNINPLSTPESDPNLQGGRRVDLLLGMHFYAPKGPLKDTRLTIEGGFPVYQSLIGPQLKSDWQFSLGLSRVF